MSEHYADLSTNNETIVTDDDSLDLLPIVEDNDDVAPEAQYEDALTDAYAFLGSVSDDLDDDDASSWAD